MKKRSHLVSAGRTSGLVLLTAAVVAACGGGGGGGASLTPAQQAAAAKPAGLAYSEQAVITTVGTRISIAPHSSGGTITSYSVSPELPAGLSLDPKTGVISGTPTAVSASKSYTVTATNGAGRTTAGVRIEVTAREIKPSGLFYPNEDSMTFVAGEAIKSVFPKAEGGKITQYSISPSLPDGLHFNTETGEISGTPSKPFAVSGYTVEGRNGAGSIKATLKIQVVSKAVKPTEPKYTNATIITRVGQPVHMDAPSTGGSSPIRYSISPPALPSGLSFNSDSGIITGTPNAVQARTAYTVTARNSAGQATTKLNLEVVAGPQWAAFNAMNTARAMHTATVLPGGRVLVTGGIQGADLLNSAEIYYTDTNRWTTVMSMNQPHTGATAILLEQGMKRGQVLVVGGSDGQNDLKSAELYSPYANQWTSVASMAQARAKPTVTLLKNGKVLVAGGYVNGQPSESAELYDPENNKWSPAGNMTSPRAEHAAVSLNDGRVLVVGGMISDGKYATTAEAYDPQKNQWSQVPNMVEMGARQAPTATLLHDGKVLVTGGWRGKEDVGVSVSLPVEAAELYDPNTNQWSSAGNWPLKDVDVGYTATVLTDGEVLFTGGHALDSMTPHAALYNPNSKTWYSTADMFENRGHQTASLLPDGTVLILGGDSTVPVLDGGEISSMPVPLATAELFKPSADMLKPAM